MENSHLIKIEHLNKKVQITATVFSKSAKHKIEKAGGTAIEL